MIGDFITNTITGIQSRIIVEAEDVLFRKFHTVISKDSNGQLHWFNPYDLISNTKSHEGPGYWVYNGISF